MALPGIHVADDEVVTLLTAGFILTPFSDPMPSRAWPRRRLEGGVSAGRVPAGREDPYARVQVWVGVLLASAIGFCDAKDATTIPAGVSSAGRRTVPVRLARRGPEVANELEPASWRQLAPTRPSIC